MRISFVWDWPLNVEQASTWKDGIAAMVRELGKRHELRVFAETPYPFEHPWFTIYPIEGVADYLPDIILHWADMTRPHAVDHARLGIPMAVCFAGGECFSYNTDLFDHIFVESQVYYDRFNEKGKSVSIAFGTNTDLFKPIPTQAKVFDAVFPATFALWKRHELFAAATAGLRTCVAGYMYPNTRESECYEVCEKAGALVLPHMSAEAVARLMAASKCVVIPSRSDGGSQRTVLEAMAMNVPVIVTDSDKYEGYGGYYKVSPTVEAIRAKLDGVLEGEAIVDTRQLVLERWSHITYADAIEKELLRLCQASQS